MSLYERLPETCLQTATRPSTRRTRTSPSSS